MFSGLIQDLGEVAHISLEDMGTCIEIEVNPKLTVDLNIGDSVSVDGVCLTVSSFKASRLKFDVIHQTLRISNLNELQVGSLVNIERSLRYGGEIGGHILSGHITGTAKAIIKKNISEMELVIDKKIEWSKYIFNKGYIAINGASLTIAKNEDKTFSIFLIPETIASTNLSLRDKNFIVNIEIDSQTIAIVNTTERLLKDISN